MEPNRKPPMEAGFRAYQHGETHHEPWLRPRADRVSWPLERLQPYAGNAKTHASDQVAKIATSMAEFGWTVPVLVAEDGEIDRLLREAEGDVGGDGEGDQQTIIVARREDRERRRRDAAGLHVIFLEAKDQSYLRVFPHEPSRPICIRPASGIQRPVSSSAVTRPITSSCCPSVMSLPEGRQRPLEKRPSSIPLP